MGEHQQDWDALRRIAAENPSPAALGPLVPWQCEYRGPDGTYGIVLHGTDPEQVWIANWDELPDLAILGIHWQTIPGGRDEEDA